MPTVYPNNWSSSRVQLGQDPQELIDMAALRKAKLNQEMAQREQMDPLQVASQQLRVEQQLAQRAADLDRKNADIQTAREVQQFYSHWPQLIQHLNTHGAPPGTAEHAIAVTEYALQFPSAFSTAEIKDKLKGHAEVADDQSKVQQNLDVLKNAGMKPTGVDITAGGGVNVRGAPEVGPGDKLQKTYGLTPEQFLNPYKVERGTPDENGKFKGEDFGNVVKVTAGSSESGEPLVRSMPVSEFNNFKKAFDPTAAPLPLTAQETATPSVAKALDADTARSLLQESGGDKDKARALAKERGYGL